MTWRRIGPGVHPNIAGRVCDGGEGAKVFLFADFVVLTVILVAGAALAARTCVLSGLVLLTLIMLLVLPEVRRDPSLQDQRRRLIVHT